MLTRACRRVGDWKHWGVGAYKQLDTQSKEVTGNFFRDSKRKHLLSPSLPMEDIKRVTTLKIPCVTISKSQTLSYSQGHQVMCTDAMRPEDPPHTWFEWQWTIHYLQVCRRRQNNVRERCLVWIRQQERWATNRCVPAAQQEMWTLSTRPSVIPNTPWRYRRTALRQSSTQ